MVALRPDGGRDEISFTDENDPNGIRTRVTAVKGRCPRPLDDRVILQLPVGDYRNYRYSAQGEMRLDVSRQTSSLAYVL